MNAPIIDLRSSVPLHRRLPVGLGTVALWTLWGLAIRHALGGLLLGGGTGSLLVLGVVLMSRWQRRRPLPALGPVTRSEREMEPACGLSAVELFRARHSQVSTVFHDENGTVLRLVCHGQESPVAEPVGCLP